MTLIDLLILAVVVGVIGYLAHWLITSFFPAPVQMPALLIVGVLLLLFLLAQFSGPADMHLYRRWR
ncbi:MAG: hypothetical protein Q7J84_00020 [Sulfuricaulis sp.]|nr:hypothetical protein [Sulfuricaulis sp.]